MTKKNVFFHVHRIGLKLQKLTCFNPDGKLVHDASTRYIRHNIAKDRKIVPFKVIRNIPYFLKNKCYKFLIISFVL